MSLYQLALVSNSTHVGAPELNAVAAALQTQVLRDLMPWWGVTATVDSFARLEDVPVTYWPIVVSDEIAEPAQGIHLDENYTPYAHVKYSNRWSLTASHEALEMLVDPFGKRLQPGPSLEPSQSVAEYLVEVCDPCEAVDFSYLVNGIVVSDFYLPSFFDPVPATRVRYSFKDTISHPLEVLRGGYLSWRDPVTNHWFQQMWLSTPEPEIHDLGVFTGMIGQTFRSWIDARVRKVHTEPMEGVPPKSPDHASLVAACAIANGEGSARAARAARLRKELQLAG